MKQHVLRLAAPLLALNLLACTQVEVEEPEAVKPLRQASVVSTSSSTFHPRAGDTVSWADGISVQAPDGIDVDEKLIELLRSDIDSEVVARGYKFAPQGSKPTYLLHGVMVLGNELNETQLRDILGFEPGLVIRDQNYQKGSLLLLLVNPITTITEWRSVVQVLTSAELTEKENEARLAYVVHSLLRPLPVPEGAVQQ
ncbi:DUF4136 domain-containing protein [Ketobacter sp. MCCC 1A13808]|uniref:hypothetical protein n=1 Tax=Ketobacter sp. MCCC 1A13808 TaxID=2602738 RepID=UPI0012EC748E|nr:hypothetical protein [Ketobacter sp. MCCC 1A13808]MVF11711.1 DUF4136 domain-containing protein [Ketobacter sp. MCCC 1A13808]